MKRKNKKKGNKEKQHINGEVEDEISAPAVRWPAISGEKRPEEKKREEIPTSRCVLPTVGARLVLVPSLPKRRKKINKRTLLLPASY